MGFFNKLLRTMPGSPVSAAKTIMKIYKSCKCKGSFSSDKEIFRHILQNRYSLIKTMKESEIDMCLNYCDDIGEVIYWCVAKENPTAGSQPNVKDTISNILDYVMKVDPENSNGLKKLLMAVNSGVEVNPFL